MEEYIHLGKSILRLLEGENRTPVPHISLMSGIMFLGQMNDNGANKVIRELLRNAVIYESKQNYYNLV